MISTLLDFCNIVFQFQVFEHMMTNFQLRKLSFFNNVEDVVLASLESRVRWRNL